MIRLEIGIEIRQNRLMGVCTNKDKAAVVVVVVVSYRSVSRNAVLFKTLVYSNLKSVESSPSNGYGNLKFQNSLMTDDPIFSKNVPIQSSRYQSSLERKIFVNLKET